MSRSLAILSLCLSPVLALDNGLALQPPMGWRSWNCYQGSVKDTDSTYAQLAAAAATAAKPNQS